MNNNRKYGLEERTSKFGEDIINYCKKIPINPINNPLITQLVKAGTSVGANYSEADDAESKKDFRHKIGIVKKESRESKHFIRITIVAVPELKEEEGVLKQEAKELNLIFNSIFRKVKAIN
ncbi:MAG: four helix bundle protein [Ignavibacteria bacterium]|nr:four helix bundle protein [Ignavibacteria bacterium]